jgi:hypothetical protein
MPCWAWVAPLIWCFILSWLLSRKSWNFINKDMECWDSGLKCTSLENVYSYNTHSRSGQANSDYTKFGANLSFSPPWSPV